MEVNGFGFEEINECQEVTLSKAFERAGSYIIKGAKQQPPPIVVGTANPSFGWIKDKIYDPWKNGTINSRWLYIQSRIYDNTPLLSQQPLYLQSLKDNLSRYEYEVFVEGNWDIQLKTGGEFFKGFELQKHVKPLQFDNEKTVHISIDSNVYPYISVQLWQFEKVGDVWRCMQVHELPCRDPDNTARKAGEKTANWLRNQGYNQRVFLYGDVSTKNRNNIDDNKRSFASIFEDALAKAKYQVTNKMGQSAPPVSNVADFVNAIFDNTLKFAEIQINETCKTSINDYIETKQDKDGGMLKTRIKDPKTGVSYEACGHCCDNLKDLMWQIFPNEFKAFQNRFNMKIDNAVGLVNRAPKITY